LFSGQALASDAGARWVYFHQLPDQCPDFSKAFPGHLFAKCASFMMQVDCMQP